MYCFEGTLDHGIDQAGSINLYEGQKYALSCPAALYSHACKDEMFIHGMGLLNSLLKYDCAIAPKYVLLNLLILYQETSSTFLFF